MPASGKPALPEGSKKRSSRPPAEHRQALSALAALIVSGKYIDRHAYEGKPCHWQQAQLVLIRAR